MGLGLLMRNHYLCKRHTLEYLERRAELWEQNCPQRRSVRSAHEIKQWERKVNDAHSKLPKLPENFNLLNKYLRDYAHAMERFERLGGYELESRARQILCRFSSR